MNNNDQITIKNSIVLTGKSLISSPQGGLYHNGVIYQFANGGSCNMYDTSFNLLGNFKLPNYIDNTSVAPHCSAVEWVVPGEKLSLTTNQAAQVEYADRVYIYDITDKTNITQDVVMLDGCDKYKYEYMAAMCFDPTNHMMFLGGYELRNHNVNSRAWFEKYDFSNYFNGITGDDGLYHATCVKQTTSSTLGRHFQDGNFYNGYLYYFIDNTQAINSSYHGVGVWVLDEEFNHVALIDINPGNTKEGEVFYIIDDNPAGPILGMGVMTNTYTIYHTQILTTSSFGMIQLEATTNVIGYEVDGEVSLGDCIVGVGTHVVNPILKTGREWYQWSDEVTTQSRTFVVTEETLFTTYSARAHSMYVTMSAVASNLETERTSAMVGPAMSLTFNAQNYSSTTNQGEYAVCSNGKYNDYDIDITTVPYNNAAAMFTRQGILADSYYFTQIPEGTTSIDVTFTTGTSGTFSADTRNPWLCIVSGDTMDTLYKNTGGSSSDDDIYRPLTQSYTIDLSAVRFKNETRAVTLKKYNYMVIRTKGYDQKGGATVTFHK